MQNAIKALVVIGFAIAIVIGLAITLMTHRADVAQTQYKIATVERVVGLFIAAVSALALLLHAINKSELRSLIGFVLSLLAGLLLMEIHWSIAIALGAIGLAIVVKEIFRLYFRHN